MRRGYSGLSTHACVVLLGLFLLSSHARAIECPQEITDPEGTIAVYQPQPERLCDTVLSGRAAMSMELKGQRDPIFGALWFEAKIDTDSDADTELIRVIKVIKLRWPDSTDANEQRFTDVEQSAVPQSGFEI